MTSCLLRMRLAHKLLISSLAFTLPLAALLYFVVIGFNANIESTVVELKGSEAVPPLVDLVGLVLRYRRLGESDAGVETEPALKRTSGAIDRAFRRLLAAPGGLEIKRIEALRGIWNELRGRPSEWEREMAHQHLVRGLEELLKQLGDSSLVLDSHLDSYYLVNVVLADLPRELVPLDEAVFSAERDLARRPKAPDLAAFAERAVKLDGTALQKVQQDAAVALREDNKYDGVSESLQSALPPLLAAHQAAVSEFTSEIARFSPQDPASVARLVQLGNAASEAALNLWQAAAGELRTLLAARIATEKRKRFSAIALSLGTLALALLLVLYIARSVARPLALVTGIAGRVAAGRLDEAQEILEGPEVKRMLGKGRASLDREVADESWRLFQAFRTMTVSLRSLLDQVRQSGVDVSGSVTGMLSSVKELEATVAEQAASTAEVAATGKEIFSSVRALAQTMQTVRQMAADAAGLASAGLEDLAGINTGMETLRDATADISRTLLSIEEQSGKITDVVTAITKVANRTNLLSLNAAIEAEKAGAHAAGFSVVATEIRRLADQTAVSALEIEASIQQMRDAVENGVKGASEYAGRTRESVASMAAVTASLGKLLENTRLLGPHFDSVNEGMQGQAQGAGQITEAMGQLNESAVHTREAIAGLQQAALEMRAAVQGLQSEVARFSTAA